METMETKAKAEPGRAKADPDGGDAERERIGIEFTGTCDLAMWCKLLRDKGWTGPRIARYLGRSEGYVNNLIRVVERASPAVLVRWREEQAGALAPACATDWLVQICLLPHAQQDQELARRVAALG